MWKTEDNAGKDHEDVCFLPGRAKDLSAPLYIRMHYFTELFCFFFNATTCSEELRGFSLLVVAIV